jgi:hypothetical protein
VLVPLASGSWLYDRYGLPRLLAAALCLTGSAALFASCGRARRSSLDAPLAALAVAAAAASVVSLDPWMSWLGLHGAYAWSVLGWGLCWAAFAASCAAQGDDFERGLALVMGGTSLAVSLYALLQWAGMDPVALSADYVLRKGRLLGSFGGPVPLGGYLTLCAPLWAYLAWEERGAARAVGLAGLACGGLALAGSGTRSAWLGAAAGMLCYRALRSRWDRRRVAAALLFLAGGLALAYFYSSRPRGDAERVAGWRAAWALFLEHPLTGVGPNASAGFLRAFLPEPLFSHGVANRSFGQPDALNDWLQVLATTGCAGFLAWLWLHLQAACSLVSSWRRGMRPVQVAMAGSLAGVFVQLKLNAASWETFLMSALLAGCLFARPDAPAGRRRLWALLAASAAALAVCVYLACADRQMRLGVDARGEGRPREAVWRMERAVAMLPGDFDYRLNLANLLWDVSSGLERPADRSALLLRAAETAREGARHRPSYPNAFALLGRAELRLWEGGGAPGPQRARLALGRAAQLDPYHPGVREDLSRLSRRGVPSGAPRP